VAQGIPSDRIVVAGFSQGGAVALLMLRSDKKLAGVVGLSTYLPLREEEGAISKANEGTPVLQAHGDQDPVVSHEGLWGGWCVKRGSCLGLGASFGGCKQSCINA